MKHLAIVNNLSELQARPGAIDSIAFLVGKSNMGDGKGGFYWWDSTTVEAEDNTYLNIIKSNNQTVGRWRRVFSKNIILPHGTLVINSGVKVFYAGATVDSSGESILNLTLENTANGTAIFEEIWFNDSRSTTPATTASDCVSGCVKSISANLKTTIHKFFKGNTVTLTLGLVFSGLVNAPAGTVVRFRVEGR